LPGVAIVTSSVPLVALPPVQAPEAEQDVALVDDQVKVTVESSKTEEDEEERLAVGLGSAGVLPPPPPPPHPDKRIITRAAENVLFLNIVI
tara:strand:+ start:76 stop:348 length:273 start_codon:yes stop_codon:yes gene_type:complete